jgi:hypothetical protein
MSKKVYNLLLPEKGLPVTGYPPGETLEWMPPDDLAGYRRRGGHATYGEHDIQYKLNRQGYRCPDFDAIADIRVVVIGCSFVLGIGLPQEHLFHERFAAQLRSSSGKSVVLWNLGRSGASNDYISRVLYLAVPWLDPHLVLINFTRPARREYVSAQNLSYDYTPLIVPKDAIARDVHGHLSALSSPFEDEVNLFRSYKAAEQLLRDRSWLFSFSSPKDFELMARHLALRHYVGSLEKADLARDGEHAGPKSHEALAGLYWGKLLETDGRRPLTWK